jgi:GntR family histidine utilization transcriptional repressor
MAGLETGPGRMSTPRYTAIKDHIIRRIDRKHWRAGDRVPSENELASEFAVSRMTARRALQELGEEGILVRTQGLGSFVADARPRSSLLEIHSIDQEIVARGHEHRAEVMLLEASQADSNTAPQLGLAPGDEIYHSILLHRENEVPLQYEERFVNPRFAGGYLEQDFTRVTPSNYLSGISPLTEADQSIEAVNVSDDLAATLDIQRSEPCLRVSRRTWCQRGIVNIAHLVYPGSRYRLGSHLNF